MLRFDHRLISILALFAMMSLFNGCGQKGPLYLTDSGVDELSEVEIDEAEQEAQVIGPTSRGTREDSGSLIPRSR